MKTMRAYGLVAVVALTFGATACGGDDEDAGGGGNADADSPLVAALAADMLTEDDGGTPLVDEAEANCWARGIVDGVGEDRLEELGVTAEDTGEIEDFDFNADEVDTIVNSLFDCVDVQQALAASFEADFGAEAAGCIAEALDEDLMKQAMTASVAGDDAEPSAEFLEEFTTIATECGIGT